MKRCLWCNKLLLKGYCLPRAPYCKRSCQQQAYARRHPDYKWRQNHLKPSSNSKGIALNRNLTFLQSAMMIYGEIDDQV